MGESPEAAAVRTFRSGDGPGLADAWTRAAPGDGITYSRFRDLFLLDRNFDASGLFVAEQDDAIVGAAYAVHRLIAADGDDLEPENGWIPFFFVVPDARGVGLGRRLVLAAIEWLAARGIRTVFFSSYTPNYFLPGLDADRYPDASRLLASLGFATQYEAVAMDRTLNDYELPARVRDRVAELTEQGWCFRSPTGDDLPELIEIAGQKFNPDWARGIREGVVSGLPLERIPRRREGMLGQRRLPLLTSRASLVNRLWRAAERQAAEIEARLASFGEDRDRERDARTLAVLARTVRELVAIDARRRAEEAADREAEDDDAMPRDLDALRDALARRIEQLRAERAQADAAGAAGEDARSSGT